MPKPVTVSAEAWCAPSQRRVTNFSIDATPHATRLILRGDRETAANASAAFGVPLPLRPCAADTRGSHASISLGPDEWLLLAPGDEAVALARLLGAACADRPHSLVDVSQRQIGMHVDGPLAARALNAGCPLDLSERSFPVGMATRTILAKCEILLWRRQPMQFHVEVGRSFADYAASFLVEAARRAPPPYRGPALV
jgi:sarcosine oxidase subunit gamma